MYVPVMHAESYCVHFPATLKNALMHPMRGMCLLMINLVRNLILASPGGREFNNQLVTSHACRCRACAVAVLLHVSSRDGVWPTSAALSLRAQAPRLDCGQVNTTSAGDLKTTDHSHGSAQQLTDGIPSVDC